MDGVVCLLLVNSLPSLGLDFENPVAQLLVFRLSSHGDCRFFSASCTYFACPVIFRFYPCLLAMALSDN